MFKLNPFTTKMFHEKNEDKDIYQNNSPGSLPPCLSQGQNLQVQNLLPEGFILTRNRLKAGRPAVTFKEDLGYSCWI